MEVKKLQNLFIEMLRSELNETELDASIKEQLTPDVISAIYPLSKNQDLSHVVAASLHKNGLSTDEETLSKYKHDEMVSVYRNQQIRYAYMQICSIFDKAAIYYIPLKGSVIRPYYPKESMRTSCDIDILVKEEDLDSAIDVLVKNGFKCGERNYHDVSLYSQNKIHLELHFNIQENIETLDSVLKDAWLYATPVNGYCCELTKEFFMFHIFAHMSYHFLFGGCGIRPLMDIWVMEHKMGIVCSQAKDLLEKAGIYVFSEEICNLVDICFSEKPSNDFYDTLLTYIFDGGIYGSLENNIAINNSKTHVNFRYIVKRIFIPCKELAIEYPILKKHCLLYLFCWLHRTFKLFFRFIKRTFMRRKASKNVSDQKTKETILLRNKLGLK